MNTIEKSALLNSSYNSTLSSIKKDFIETLVNFMVESDIIEAIEWFQYKRYNDSSYDKIISIHKQNINLEYKDNIVPKTINDGYYLDNDYDNCSYGSNAVDGEYSENFDKVFNEMYEFITNIETDVYVAMFGMGVSVKIDKTGSVDINDYYHE